MTESDRREERDDAIRVVRAVLENIEAKGGPLSLWQQICLSHALADLTYGLYTLACLDALDASERNHVVHLRPLHELGRITALTIHDVRSEIDRISSIPPVFYPIFGKLSGVGEEYMD